MRAQTCLIALAPLLEQLFFTAGEARGVGVSAATIGHYVKTGLIKRVERGVYQGINYHNTDSFRWDDLIQAVYAEGQGVVCLLSALSVYDLTEEIPRQHWIGIRHGTTAKKSRLIKFVRFRNFELGRTVMELDGVKLPIYDRERTIVDAFRLLSRETAIKSLRKAVVGKNRIDLSKLEVYAKKLRFDISPYLLSVTT